MKMTVREKAELRKGEPLTVEELEEWRDVLRDATTELMSKEEVGTERLRNFVFVLASITARMIEDKICELRELERTARGVR